MWGSELYREDLSNDAEVVRSRGFHEFASLFTLATFVQADTSPPVRSAAYLFGHTVQNSEPILSRASELYLSNRVDALYATKLAEGYPPLQPGDYSGFEAWRDSLVDRGVDPARIRSISSPKAQHPGERPPIAHTGTEASAIVALAREMQWQTLVLVAHPMHMLRAFLYVATNVVRGEHDLLVYCKPGMPAQDWQEEVVLNQGVVHGSRLEIGMRAEFQRIIKWRAKGDIIRAEEAFAYICYRDLIARTRF